MELAKSEENCDQLFKLIIPAKTMEYFCHKLTTYDGLQAKFPSLMGMFVVVY